MLLTLLLTVIMNAPLKLKYIFNTARKIFRNFEKSAEITGIDVELKFGDILMVLANGYEINIEAFKEYC